MLRDSLHSHEDTLDYMEDGLKLLLHTTLPLSFNIYILRDLAERLLTL